MGFPQIINAAMTKGKSMEGVITSLKRRFSNEDVLSLVSPSCGGSDIGHANETVIRENNFRAFNFLQFSFGKRLMFPTHYSLRGAGTSDNLLSHNWSVYGFNEEDRENIGNWDLLGSHTRDNSTFCGSGNVCLNTNFDTFPLTQTNKGYNYLQLVPIDTTMNGRKELMMKEIDIFGSLTVNPYLLQQCIRSNQKSCRQSISFLVFIYIQILHFK